MTRSAQTFWHLGVACALLAPAWGCSDDDTPPLQAPYSSDAGVDSEVDGSTLPDATVEDAHDVPNPRPCQPAAGEVTLTTEDGVSLEADLYTTGFTGAPGVVLLHMVPPSNDRTNYPAEFITELRGQGFDVINLDRRGAGGSGGVDTEAYEGPNGKLDALAAYRALVDGECETDPGNVVFIGASNGSTTALDFTVDALTEGTAHPAGLVFLTGGAYTENQNDLAASRSLIEDIPLLFVFSTGEREWSASFMTDAPDTWEFEEYDPGDHGTRMFEAQPTSMTRVAEFAAEAARR